MLVKSDVGGNIDRLARSAATNPERYDADILVIVEDEVQAGGAASSSSSTKGLLWLKRWVRERDCHTALGRALSPLLAPGMVEPS